jgi:mono/diheme cytochrome c family protein
MTMLLFFALAALGFLNSQALGQTANSSDINQGKELAERACGSCHVVRADQQQAPILNSAAPSFEEIAQGTKADIVLLNGFLSGTQSNVSHPGGMPNPQLRGDEIQKVSEYILSLRRQK